MTRPPDREVLLRTSEVARDLNVAHKTVNGWLQRGEIRGGRLPGGHWRVPASEVARIRAEILSTDRSEGVT